MTAPEDPLAVGWELLHTFERDRDWRREHPDLFLAEIGADLWRTMDEEEAIEDFVGRAPLVPWWANDVVDCLARVLHDLPDRAPSILVASGLWLGAGADAAPGRYLDFLERQLARMRTELDALRRVRPQTE